MSGDLALRHECDVERGRFTARGLQLDVVMKFSPLLSILTTCLAISASAFAQPADNGPDNGEASAETSAGAPTPPGGASMNEVQPGPTVLPCTVRHHPCAYPHLVVGLDGGVSHFTESGPFGFDTSVGSITKTGAAWGATVGAQFRPWFALEAHYIGLSNRAVDSVSVGGSRGLLTTAVVGELRFMLPNRYFEPYLLVGAGVYSTSITGSSVTTQLTKSTEFGMPLGIGFQVPLSAGVSLGAEGVYHRLFGESFAPNDDIGGGDPVSATLVLRVHL